MSSIKGGVGSAVKGSTLLEYTYGWISLPGQFVDISPGRFVANGHSKHLSSLGLLHCVADDSQFQVGRSPAAARQNKAL